MLRRFFILAAVVLAGIGLVYFVVDRLTREPPNYSRIDNGLYLGGYVVEPPPRTAAVLNLCEVEDPYQAELHRWDPIPDAEPAPNIDWLRRAVKFVAENNRAGRTVYVHCRNGVSRGGMVVTAYLMMDRDWTRDEALAFIRSKRPEVRPHPVFMKLLADWELALKKS